MKGPWWFPDCVNITDKYLFLEGTRGGMVQEKGKLFHMKEYDFYNTQSHSTKKTNEHLNKMALKDFYLKKRPTF